MRKQDQNPITQGPKIGFAFINHLNTKGPKKKKSIKIHTLFWKFKKKKQFNGEEINEASFNKLLVQNKNKEEDLLLPKEESFNCE